MITTPAGGGGSTTTTYGYDAAGHFVSEQVQNPDGSEAEFTRKLAARPAAALAAVHQ